MSKLSCTGEQDVAPVDILFKQNLHKPSTTIICSFTLFTGYALNFKNEKYLL